MSTITIRTSEAEKQMLQNLAEFHGMNLSEFIRDKMIEIAENEFDLQAYDEAVAYNTKHTKTYSIAEAAKELGIDL